MGVDAIVPVSEDPLPDPADRILALTMFQQQDYANGGRPVLLQDTSLKDGDMQDMEARGILAASVDELGNVSVSVLSGRVDWATEQLIVKPKALSTASSGIDVPMKQQEVEVLVALHKLGWRHGDAIDESWVPGSVLGYTLRLNRPELFLCLARPRGDHGERCALHPAWAVRWIL